MMPRIWKQCTHHLKDSLFAIDIFVYLFTRPLVKAAVFLKAIMTIDKQPPAS